VDDFPAPANNKAGSIPLSGGVTPGHYRRKRVVHKRFCSVLNQVCRNEGAPTGLKRLVNREWVLLLEQALTV